jgi:hypothetical protein
MDKTFNAEDLVNLGWDQETAEKVAAAMDELADAMAPLSEQGDAITSSRLDLADWSHRGSSANVVTLRIEMSPFYRHKISN